MSAVPFRNENTWFHANRSPEALEAFHAGYENALKDVRGRIGRTFPIVIDGREETGAGTFDDVNPSDGREVLGRFQKGTPELVERAVRAAKAAQPAWEAVGHEERARVLDRAAAAMAARKLELAAIMTLENGKNRVEAIYDVDEAIDFLRYYAYVIRERRGFETPMGSPFPEERCTSVMRPWGVFGVIGPFNFPLAIPTGMTSGALVTGNAAVLKPASDTPWIAFELYGILRGAGVPGGVLHYVTGGGREVGQPLIDHPLLDGLVFTGSRDVGMRNYASFVGTRPRPYVCEMGGKNAIVVTARADLGKAVDGVIRSAFGFGGQKCSACSRAYAHRSVYDEFARRLAEKAKALEVGSPEARDNGFGPVVNAAAVRTYEDAVAKATAAGGRVLAGGRVVRDGPLGAGNFVEPCVVDALPAGHDAFRTEYFVPFLAIAPYDDFERVIDEVNAVDYGLTSGIFSEDPAEVERYFTRAEAGVVYANRARGGSTGAMVGGQSFGGWKFSATTSRGAGGPHYLQQFLREQSRTVDRGS